MLQILREDVTQCPENAEYGAANTAIEEASSLLTLKGGASFKGKITEMRYWAERKLEEGLKRWDVRYKSHVLEQGAGRYSSGIELKEPANAGETGEVERGCVYKELNATLFIPLSPPAPDCFCP